MFVIEELKLNKFQQVSIPRRRELFARFARLNPELGHDGDTYDFPVNVSANKVDELRIGSQLAYNQRLKADKERILKEQEEAERSKAASGTDKSDS